MMSAELITIKKVFAVTLNSISSFVLNIFLFKTQKAATGKTTSKSDFKISSVTSNESLAPIAEPKNPNATDGTAIFTITSFSFIYLKVESPVPNAEENLFVPIAV